MNPTLVLDTSVLIAGLRSSLGASFALLELVGSGRFTWGRAVWYRGYHAGRGAPASGGRTMSGFTVELPAELQAEVARRANQQPGGESAWVADAVREKLAACAELEYLEARGTGQPGGLRARAGQGVG